MKISKPLNESLPAEQAAELYRSILGTLPLTTFLYDRNKNLIEVYHPSSVSIEKYRIESYIGSNIMDYINDESSLLHDQFVKFNEIFDRVLATGEPGQFEYEVDGEYIESGVAPLGENHVISYVRNTTPAVKKQLETERMIRNELSLAMTVGGLTSWSFDVEKGIISTKHDNEVIGDRLTYDEFLARIDPQYRHRVSELFGKITGRETDRAEATLPITDIHGKQIWINVHAMAQEYAPDGKVSVIVGSQKDVTRELADKNGREELLKQNALIMNNAACGFVYITPDYRVAWENTAHVLPPEFDDGTRFFEVGEPCYKNEHRMQNSHTRKFVEAAFREKTVQRIEKRIQSRIWIDMTASPVVAGNGTVEGVVLKIENVTERVSLRNEYENLYRQTKTILDSLPVGVEVYGTDGRLLFLNDTDYRIFGLDKENFDLSRINIQDNPNLPIEIKEGVTKGMNTHATFAYHFDAVKDAGFYATSQEGVLRIECDGHPVIDASGRIENYVFIVRDVTEQEHTDDELRQNKRKMELAMQDADIMLWEFDVRQRLFFSDNEPLNGYDHARPLTIDDYLSCIYPGDEAPALETLQKMCAGEACSFKFDVRIKLPGYPDEWQYCTINGSSYQKDGEGKATKFIGTRKNNTELQKKKQLQEAILNSIPVSIHIKDVDDNFRYVFCNDESKRLFGTSEDTTTYDVMDPDKVARIEKTDKEVFATGKPYFGLEHIELKDGRVYDTLVRKSVVYDDGRRLLLNVRWDQSLQNDLERRAKVLNITMEAMNAYTWFYEPEKDKISFGEGSDKFGRDILHSDSLEKFIRFIHPDERKLFMESIRRLIRNETDEWNVEYRADLRNSGVYEWWQTRGMLETTLRDDIPYTYMFGMTINIEEHKQTELTLLKNREELNHLIRQNEMVLNNANSGLAYISTDYIVQWENISMCSASLSHEAYRKGTICYQSTRGRTSPCENCVMQLSMRSRQMEQAKFTFDNGHTVEVFATPVFRSDRTIDGVVVRIDDVTERERMIKELKQAKALAEQSDKLKSAFLANMSHEIRTPLNAIVGFSGLLMETTEQQEKEEYIKIIHINNELLLKLINDILDLSKIESGSVELQYEDFDLSEYFDDMVTSMKQRMTNPGVRLIASNPYSGCKVRLDKNRIAQIMTNYVTNAIKYTRKGFIEMGYESKDEGIRLYVKDSGIGIPEDKKHKVFHRFEKLDEFAQGTGLGLSICKAIAESMGGYVGYESRYGEGSLFWAVLPCNAEVQPLEKQLDSLTETPDIPERKTILVAEDIPSNYRLVSALLEKRFDLIHAKNGREAVEIAGSGRADLVLMDMRMPVMDGLTATAEIRKFDPEIPIVALTAHAFDTDQLAALEAGCNEYLLKPIDKTKLMAVLRKYCHKP